MGSAPSRPVTDELQQFGSKPLSRSPTDFYPRESLCKSSRLHCTDLISLFKAAGWVHWVRVARLMQSDGPKEGGDVVSHSCRALPSINFYSIRPCHYAFGSCFGLTRYRRHRQPKHHRDPHRARAATVHQCDRQRLRGQQGRNFDAPACAARNGERLAFGRGQPTRLRMGCLSNVPPGVPPRCSRGVPAWIPACVCVRTPARRTRFV